MKNIAVIGAGGFAREVEWLIEDITLQKLMAPNSDSLNFAGFIVSDTSTLGTRDSQVLGDLSYLDTGKIDALAIGIGTPEVRLKLGRELSEKYPHIKWPTLIHPSAQFSSRCIFGKGVIICAGVIATVNVHIDDFAMVNLSCTIGHEARIGKGCVLNPSVNISGGVHLEDGVLVGTGAQILQYVRVGRNATIGASSLLRKDVEANSTVVGVPARAMAMVAH